MGWKRFTQKQKLAVLKRAEQMGVKEAARGAGVHYTTVYDWKSRLEALGEEGFLSYKPSMPGRGIKKISPQKEEAVLSAWKRYPALGPGQVRNQLRRQGPTVSMKTVRQIMEANGYQGPRKRTKQKEEGNRFEARRPMELRSKGESGEDQGKLDQLHGLIRYHGLALEPAALKQAEKAIKAYEKEAISDAEEIFTKVVNREPGKKTLP